MSHLVRNHVRLREVTRSLEARPQVFIERQVDVDGLVQWTIKRAHRGLTGSTTRRCVAAEDHQRRGAIRLSCRTEQRSPDVFGAAEDGRDEIARRIIGGGRLAGPTTTA